MMGCFDDLPIETIQQITSYLSDSDLLSVTLISKRCKPSALANLYKHVVLTYDAKSRHLAEALKDPEKAKYVRTFNLCTDVKNIPEEFEWKANKGGWKRGNPKTGYLSRPQPDYPGFEEDNKAFNSCLAYEDGLMKVLENTTILTSFEWEGWMDYDHPMILRPLLSIATLNSVILTGLNLSSSPYTLYSDISVECKLRRCKVSTLKLTWRN